MDKHIIKIVTLLGFIAAALIIALLVFAPDVIFRSQNTEIQQPRVVIPRTVSANELSVTENNAERMVYEEVMMSKAAMNDGEYLLAVINQNFDEDPQEEQIIAYRKPAESDGPVYAAYIDFDSQIGSYRRVWETAAAVTKPGTLNIYTDDLIGDRSVCLVIMGMNSANEQTLTVFRKNSGPGPVSSTVLSPVSGQNIEQASPPEFDANTDFGNSQEIFHKIAELSIDGSIVIKEIPRSTAYQIMFSPGDSYSIAAYGRDYASSNIMDQIEVTYSYNPVNGLYERTGMAKIPGSQIEQQQVRELLSGSAGKFESFINGLWYAVSPQGSLNKDQFIYFDPENREIIFHGEDTYQVFVWQTSTPTRYGLQIGSQNSSVATLIRTISIELGSLESVRISVREDVRLKIGVSTPWNGTYRKANIAELSDFPRNEPAVSHFDAVYEGYIGRIAFSEDGAYQLTNGASLQQGMYAFFTMDDMEFLELRPVNILDITRDIYRVERPAETESISSAGELTLHRVRIGTRRVQELHEAAISLTKAEE